MYKKRINFNFTLDSDDKSFVIGFVHIFESLSLPIVLSISAENVGRAGIIGDLQHTLSQKNI